MLTDIGMVQLQNVQVCYEYERTVIKNVHVPGPVGGIL